MGETNSQLGFKSWLYDKGPIEILAINQVTFNDHKLWSSVTNLNRSLDKILIPVLVSRLSHYSPHEKRHAEYEKQMIVATFNPQFLEGHQQAVKIFP